MPDLVVVESDLSLGGLEALLYRPAHPGNPHEGRQRRRFRCEAQVVRALAGGSVAADQQLSAGDVAVQDDPRPPVGARALGAGPSTAGLPGVLGKTAGRRVGTDWGAATVDAHAGGTRHRRNIASATSLQLRTQGGVLSVDLVSCDPPGRGAGVERGGDHVPGEVRLRREHRLLGYADCRAAGFVGAPAVLGQVEPTVDQRSPAPGRVGEEHPYLGVLDPSGGAGVLPLDTGRVLALLQDPVSSTIRTPSGSPGRATTRPLRSSRTASASQRAERRSRCIASGRRYPQRSADDQQFLRSTSESRPTTNSRAVARGSTRANQPAALAITSPSTDRHRSGFTRWLAATARS